MTLSRSAKVLVRGTGTCWLVAALFIAACSSSSSVATSNDAGAGADDAQSTADGGSTSDAALIEDSATSGSDASAGAACTFNRDCIATQRCECSEATGCFCADGARGTGRNGIDPCSTGDDCASSLCVEGPDGGSFCSDECTDKSGCTGALPVCESIAGIGMICARTP